MGNGVVILIREIQKYLVEYCCQLQELYEKVFSS